MRRINQPSVVRQSVRSFVVSLFFCVCLLLLGGFDPNNVDTRFLW